MVVRIILLLLGVGLAGGGGYLSWLNRGLSAQLFPPDPNNPPWMLLAGLLGVIIGLVLLVAGMLPQGPSKAEREADEAKRKAAIRAADAFYGERARSADRDWRSGDLPPQPAPAAAAPVRSTERVTSVPPPAPQPVAARPVTAPPPVAPTPPPQPEPVAAAPAPTPPPAPAANPAPAPPPPQPAPVTPAPAPVAPAAPTAAPLFPGAASLKPIPRATDAPAQPLPPAAGAKKPNGSAAPPTSNGSPIDEIRSAIAMKRLEAADKLLNEERARLTALGGHDLELAELTALAGDHAAAGGRIGAAKWLWRLAIQRFGQAGAMDAPAAKAASERLRLADQ